MTHIMCHGFHACNSFEHMTGFMAIDRLIVGCVVTHMSSLMGLKIELTYES